MPKWDTTNAPLAVTVDNPRAFSGNHDERPVKLTMDARSGHTTITGSGDAQASLHPAEVYHLVDDLLNAADECWGAAEYAVTAVRPDGDDEHYLTTIKAPSPEEAVRRTRKLLETRAHDGGPDSEVAEARLDVIELSDGFRTYRADSMTHVPDDTDT